MKKNKKKLEQKLNVSKYESIILIIKNKIVNKKKSC